MNIEDFKKALKKARIQKNVFSILEDKKWHCRDCAASELGKREIRTSQYAGGGGIQGLQRGTSKRPGLEIETKTQYCNSCEKITTSDRWTGRFQASTSAAGIGKELRDRVLKYYGYRDVVEQSKRPSHQLIIDHRFPMQRWGSPEMTSDKTVTDDEIQRKFQLLKKDKFGNHNLLKSRSCEECKRTGKRGKPFGIKFWYRGDESWSKDIPEVGPEAEKGCQGCGWYNFDEWRKHLNRELKKNLNQELKNQE